MLVETAALYYIAIREGDSSIAKSSTYQFFFNKCDKNSCVVGFIGVIHLVNKSK